MGWWTSVAALYSPIYSAAVTWVIQAEGGSRLVDDTGGLTRYGISTRAHPDVDVRTLTREGAERIYHEKYWLPLHADSLPAALALVLFDSAVNLGVSQAVKLAQKLVLVEVDGAVGPKTVSAIKVYQPRQELIARYLEARLRWYDSLVSRDSEKYGRYLYGWRMRVMRLALEAGRWRTV